MFQPCNKYILIERFDPAEPETESLIALPDGFDQHKRPHELVLIKSVARGVHPPLASGQKAVVLSHMIEEVDFGKEKIYLVLEHNVLGTIGGDG